jgi:hypothetical protein
LGEVRALTLEIGHFDARLPEPMKGATEPGKVEQAGNGGEAAVEIGHHQEKVLKKERILKVGMVCGAHPT